MTGQESVQGLDSNGQCIRAQDPNGRAGAFPAKFSKKYQKYRSSCTGSPLGPKIQAQEGYVSECIPGYQSKGFLLGNTQNEKPEIPRKRK